MADILPPENNPVAKKPIRRDADGNEISLFGKYLAGFLLISLTAATSLGIIAYWPDRAPIPGEKIAPLYINQPFHVRLACLPDTPCCADCAVVYKYAADTLNTDSVKPAIITATVDSLTKDTIKKPVQAGMRRRVHLIHLNTLLLLLVALGGFLGNMIHISTSFTTFVGAGKFRQSWILWYCIKPFTASALAIGIYFVFRGGFLNMSDDGSSINLYGLMTISIFAGLFTDKATEKLKDIFEVVFKSKDERPNTLVGKLKIAGITPLVLEKGKENKLTLAGEKMDLEKLSISINDEPIEHTEVKTGSIIFSYRIPDAQADKTEFKLLVKSEEGKSYYSAVLHLKKEGTEAAGSGQAPANTGQGSEPDQANQTSDDSITPEPGLG